MIADFDAIVLAGGLGTRLRSVLIDRPKPMASVSGRPFLDHVLDHLRTAGIHRVILSVGYLGEQIEQHYGDRFEGMSVVYSREAQPLGTGGALRQALTLVESDHALAVNGDTLLRCDLRSFMMRAVRSGRSLGLLTRWVDDASRFGRCELAGDTLVSFGEKAHSAPGLINAGVYCLSRRLFDGCDEPAPFSFERDLIAPGVSTLRPYAERAEGYFIDIGVPDDLARAQREITAVRQ